MNINATLGNWIRRSEVLALFCDDGILQGFIDTLSDNQEIRYAQSVELFKRIRRWKPEMFLLQFHKELAEFEYNREFYDGYRDHVTHMIKVFLLGVYIYENTNTISTFFSDSKEDFLRTWVMTSLFHDIGYLFETSNKEKEDKTNQKSLDIINGFLKHPLSLNYDTFSAATEDIVADKDKGCRPTLLQDFSDADCNETLWEILKDAAIQTKIQVDDNKNALRELYVWLRTDHAGYVYKDHGICSAIILLYMENQLYDYLGAFLKKPSPIYLSDLQKETLAHFEKDQSKQHIIIHTAAKAIAVHNIKNYENTPNEKKILNAGVNINNFRVDANTMPYAYLLKACDEMSCWDRPQFALVTAETVKNKIFGKDLGLSAEKQKIILSFCKEQHYRSISESFKKIKSLFPQIDDWLKIEEDKNIPLDPMLPVPSVSGPETNRLKQYLDNCLVDIRNNHPSFKLMDKDDIDERLLPGIKEQYLSEALAKESDDGTASPVWKLIQSYWNTPSKRNIVIQGDGGIGKTVTLLSLTSSANAVLHAPAIYIPLHELVTKEEKCLDVSSYLKQKYPEYYDEIGKLAAGSWENGPKMLLMLDGFNEVPISLRSEILRNIIDWDNAHPGTQIIAVSRPTTGISLQELSGNPVEVTLEPLKQETVRAYLKDWKIAIPKDSSPVWKVLTYPLFLTLYVKTGKLTNLKSDGYSLAPKHAESGGALIWNFLQRELLRISSEEWVFRCALACEYIIPIIAYHMAKKQQFVVSRQEAMEYIDEAIKELNTNMLPRHLDKLYQEYQNRHFSIPNHNNIKWYETVLQDTGMLVFSANSNTYKFMHQSFRDCLAGLYLVNQMEMAEKSDNYPLIWKESHHPDLIKYASELMHQETFAHLWEKNRLLHPTHHTGTINLLETRKHRDDWGELNFSGMNLCDLNLGRYMCHDQYDLNLFRKPELTIDTKINKATFQSEGHGGFVNCIVVTLDGLCISGSNDTTLHVCDSHSGECLHILEGHKDDIKCVVLTPEGLCISGSEDDTLRVWDPHTGECLHILEGHKAGINCVGVTSDGLCVSGSEDGTLCVWDPHTGECLHILEGHKAGIHCVGVIPDGLCVSGSEDGTLRVWDLHTGECLRVVEGHKDTNLDIAVTQDGLCVSGWGTHALCIWDPHTGECINVLMDNMLSFYHIVLTQDGLCISTDWKTLYIWDLHSGKCLHILKGHKEHIKCVVITPDGMCISGSYDKTLRIWDPHTGECRHILEGHSGYVTCVALTPDGLCISGSWDFTLCIWNPRTGECLHALEGGNDDIIYVAVAPNDLCVSVTLDGRLCVWDTHGGRCLYTLEGHEDFVFSCAITQDGLCISGSMDNTLRVWNLHTGKYLHTLEGHTGPVCGVAVTQDGLCISGSSDDTLRVWNPYTGECLRVLEGHKGSIFHVAVTSDGLCISGSADKTLRVWDPHTGECLHILEGHKKAIHDVVVTSEGLCVSKSEDHTLRVWDVHSGKCLHVLEEHKKAILDVAVTLDGLCIGGLRDNNLYIWDMHSGKRLRILEGHKRAVACVAATLDGLCISGSEDNTLRVWDSHTGECLRVLEGHTNIVTHAVVISDELCISGSSDNTLRVWNIHSGECLHVLEKMSLNVQGMNLSKTKMDMELKKILQLNGVIIE